MLKHTEVLSFDVGFQMPFNPQKIRERRLRAAEGYLELNLPDHALRELDEIENLGDATSQHAVYLR